MASELDIIDDIVSSDHAPGLTDAIWRDVEAIRKKIEATHLANAELLRTVAAKAEHIQKTIQSYESVRAELLSSGLYDSHPRVLQSRPNRKPAAKKQPKKKTVKKTPRKRK